MQPFGGGKGNKQKSVPVLNWSGNELRREPSWDLLRQPHSWEVCGSHNPVSDALRLAAEQARALLTTRAIS